MELIDRFLNKFTMYRFTLYFLIALVIVAVIASFLGVLPYNPMDILLDVGIVVTIAYVSNYVFAKLFHAVTNAESVFITALIIVLIFPVKFPVQSVALAIIAVFAMGSKYFVTIEKRHMFNPAAAAVLGFSLLSSEHAATWWIGTPLMMPFVLVGGLLLMRKIRRETMLLHFFIAYFLLTAAAAIWNQGTLTAVISIWQRGIFQSSLLFFAFIMLTEPLTSPATEKLQKWYAYVVALLFVTPQLRFSPIVLTPEWALCLGNIFSYFISPNYRLALPLSWKQIGGNIGIFAFVPTQKIVYTPGQYMEWTLPHRLPDSRGNRRYFSLASSPTEKELLLAVKFYSPSSSYKKRLATLQKDEKIVASQIAGDFVLPKDLTQPLVFIAGGVGIVPYRSMIKYILDKNLQVNIVLLYADHSQNDFIFTDIFNAAEKNGLRSIYTITDKTLVPEKWQGEVGYITAEMIKKVIPNYKDRIFYLSGPQLMVDRYAATLGGMGIGRSHIKQDFFPGYAES